MSEYVTVEPYTTDDPDVMELVTNQSLAEEGDEVYNTPEEMELGTVLSQALFFAVAGMGMLKLTITADTLIVTRNPDTPWEVLIDELRDALRDYYL
jgi:hypothetical protein